MNKRSIVFIGLLLILSAVTYAQRFDSGSTGVDGEFSTTTLGTIWVDMADHPSGIYNYTSVNILAGQTIKFIPNLKNRPVVWLVQGDVIINGTIDVSGQNGEGNPGIQAMGGPGGWPGGLKDATFTPYQGLGPGGAQVYNGVVDYGTGAGHATLGADNWQNPTKGNIYGNRFGIPLMGGSGGGAGNENTTDIGGGGGGAILIAASGTISISGTNTSCGIFANGGWPGTHNHHGGGSGGTIRLVSNSITLSGQAQIQAMCSSQNATGKGYVRLEAYYVNVPAIQVKGYLTRGAPNNYLLELPPDSATLKIKSVGGLNVGDDPGGSAIYPDIDIPVGFPNPVAIVVEGTGLDDGTTITLRINADKEKEFREIDGVLSGTSSLSSCTFNVNIPEGIGTLYVRTK